MKINEITPDMESEINNIIYYYNQQKRIHELQEYITSLYDKIHKTYDSMQKIRKNISVEMTGEYKDVLDFVPVNGKYEMQAINKKIREGKLESVKQYLECTTEHKAINMYLKEHGVKINQIQELAEIKEINIDELLGLESARA